VPPQYNNAVYSTIKDLGIIHCARDNQGNRGGSEEEDMEARDFGGGRGLVVFHNFQKIGHYARDFPQPPMTCMYFHTTYHEIEYCPTLLIKYRQEEPDQPKMCNGSGWKT
jgi:hypothetical protein